MAEQKETGEARRGLAIKVHSIALTLDCSTLNRTALETAVALAAATRARLCAVFIENQRLFELAELPCVRHVSGAGRAVASIDAGHMHQDVERACEAARRAVSDAAGRARIEWAFDTRRGLLDEALASAGADAEIVALGSSLATIGRVHSIAALRAMLRHGTGVIVAPSKPLSPAGPVVGLVGPGADPTGIVHTVESICERAGRAYRFVVLGPTAAERKALADLVSTLSTGAAKVTICDDDAFNSVAWSARNERASLAVADIDYACFDETSSVERIAEAFGCPMLLVQV